MFTNKIVRLPIIRGLKRKLEILRQLSSLYIPPGHFYSPIVSKSEIIVNQERIFGSRGREIPGIDLQIEAQLDLVRKFSTYYSDFSEAYGKETTGKTFRPQNGYYSFTDAIFLYCMIRHFGPSKIIEVGSGFSSTLMLDINRDHFNDTISLAFVEPYPEDRLMGLLPANSPNVEVVKSKVQDLQVSFFSRLDRNDILFVDSSHVLKTGSDLHFILFEVLPALNPGTMIHFHDIFFPFEYPKEHVLGDRWFSWNEAYALRAFLSYNSDYEIIVWNSCLEALEKEVLLTAFPLYGRGGSASIWLRKL